MIHVDEAMNGRTLTLEAGDRFELSLPENPTTGYQWEIEEGADPVCVRLSDRYERSSERTGSGGVRRWLFEAARAGEGEIRLSYRRSPEGEAPKSFSLRVVAA